MKDRRLYAVWKQMIYRCTKPNHPSYKRYGGRGISICEDWLNSFDTFSEWALNNGYERGLSIDRIDNGGNYEPDNCRWVDRVAQQNNTRRNRFITVNDETHSVSEWARITGFSKNGMIRRFNNWNPNEAVNRSKCMSKYDRENNRKYDPRELNEMLGKGYEHRDILSATGWSPATVSNRVRATTGYNSKMVDRDAIRKLLNNYKENTGKSYKDVGKDIGLSEHCVSYLSQENTKEGLSCMQYSVYRKLSRFFKRDLLIQN